MTCSIGIFSLMYRNLNEGIKDGNRKGLQTEICKPLILLARPGGFEPPTYGFVVRHSIQLSYGRLFEIWALYTP